ncbi:MAG: hypothetical protein CVV27_07280 [Candidatus Melainabacteria bacterium HGW-Melainabacteria-1]|nr:MAG: hypothetical protein CVV27_07280 [Candidatus Melainabacteria bacterium HGW-Melainabacteria-1]
MGQHPRPAAAKPCGNRRRALLLPRPVRRAQRGRARALPRRPTGEAIDWYLPHQVNRALTSAVAEQAGIPANKQIHVLDRYASATAAGVLLALHHAREHQHFAPGQLLAFNTVGGGLSWGAVIWRV